MTEGRILAAVTGAEGLRRRRLLAGALVRLVPAIAGGLLVAAAFVRLAHLPLMVFWIASAVALVGVAAFALLKSRVPAVTDAAAAQLDADAALGGELRSAHWFASQTAAGTTDARDAEAAAWATHHLDIAATRVDQVAWPSVYPPLKTARAWAGSIALAVSAIALALTSAWPSQRVAPAVRGAAVPGSGVADPAATLDLEKQIGDLIDAVQKGKLPFDVARTKMSELNQKLASLTPEQQAALAKAAQNGAPKHADDEEAPPGDDLASKAEKAAAGAAIPQDMKWSLQDLAAKLNNANKAPTLAKGDAKEPGKDSQTGAPNEAGAQKAQDAGAQMTRSAAQGAESTQVMTTSSPMSGDAGAPNGGQSPKGRAGGPLDLATLKKETIEADSDSQGANVLAEMRRKSEQSHSTLSFSHVAPLAAYDKSHATAPPAPPDALRALVKQYFIRK